MAFQLETGRTHQIRVHMASIGHPIIGDPVYGLKKDRFSNIGGQCLHAAHLTLTHPKTGEKMCFSAPLPQYFVEILDKLEKKGLATATSGKGKEKKEFQITKEGLEALKANSKKLISERRPANAHLMTGLATAYLLDDKELRAAFFKRKEKLEDDLADMQSKQNKEQHKAPIAQQLFSLSQTLLEAELDWIKQELQKLEN